MTEPQSTDYLLLFRGTKPASDASPEEMQAFMGKWMKWYEELAAAGKFKGGHPLDEGGKLVTGPGGESVADGPFPESKEAIAGFFHLSAGSLEEATEMARRCPGLAYGGTVEVRSIADHCSADVSEKPAGETAVASA